MSILSTLKQALRNEEHSQLIGDEVAVYIPPVQKICPKKKRQQRLLTLLNRSEESALDKDEVQSLIRLLREQLHYFQKQEHVLLMEECKRRNLL